MSSSVYLGLIHGPVKNKQGEQITTSVTNLDIHDIARSCRTFGLKNYFIVTPIKKQQELVGRILGHWEEDKSNLYNPDRHSALRDVQLAPSLVDVIKIIEEKERQAPFVVVTGANFSESDGDCLSLLSKNKLDGRPILLLFGTGWGLTATVCEQADFRLQPIWGAAEDGYNHLSVRSAVAIYLDRLRAASDHP